MRTCQRSPLHRLRRYKGCSARRDSGSQRSPVRQPRSSRIPWSWPRAQPPGGAGLMVEEYVQTYPITRSNATPQSACNAPWHLNWTSLSWPIASPEPRHDSDRRSPHGARDLRITTDAAPRPSPGSCSKADSKRTSSRQPRSGATHSHPDGDEATLSDLPRPTGTGAFRPRTVLKCRTGERANDPTTSSGQPGRGQGVHRMPGACSRADRPTSIVPRSVHVRDQDVQPR